MKKLSGEKKKNYYGYSPVIMLMSACVCVLVALMMALLMPDSKKIDDTNKNNNIEISDNISTQVSEQAQDLKESDEFLELENEEQMIDENIQQVQEPEEEAPLFTVSDKSYFDDALFIGDSRTVGLREYGTFENAHYFATPGLSLYSIESTKVEMKDGRKLKLEQLLSENTYGKVYVMLGINELGYDFDATVRKYQAFIDYIFTMQPDTILYVCANMHVNSLRNELDDIHNNTAINRMNEQIASFADNEKIFYLDINPVFDDEDGNLAQEYISDDTHLMGNYYEVWCNWYCENTVVLPDC